jgi:rod shape-determining protein MreC|uniref:rod shape-determining protein MreC n=1 Tax=Fluviicola sp. TaxID=1917219 RepID=UPI0040493AB0
MRNLLAFFQRFRIFLVFVLLQIIALTTYVRYSEFARLQALSTISGINSSVMSARNDVVKHFNLENTNKLLSWENAWLKQQLKLSNYRIKKGVVSIDDTLYKQQFKYIPATAIHSTFDKRNNYMTIDIGANHGIKKGWGVFSSQGVVGIVHTVGNRYSLVKTILSKNINIDVMLEKGGAFGLLKWDAASPKHVQISGISNDLRIKKWSRVITKGGSGIFPRGIPVGRVVEKRFMEGRPLWDIHLLTAVDFRTIQHVYVVKNIHLDELEQLQEAIPADKEEDEF